MDETTIKAGRTQPGKMRTAYFWPVYGEADEIVFHYAPSRAHEHVETFLAGFRGTLLSAHSSDSDHRFQCGGDH